MRKPILKQRAFKLWADNLKKGNILRTTKDISDENVRAILRKEDLLFPIRPGYFILKKPEDDPKQLFTLLYWQIITFLLKRYEPWSIRGQSALLLYIGNQENPKNLLVRSGKKTNYNMSLPYGYKLSLLYDERFDSRTVKKVSVAGQTLKVDIPEKVLIDLVARKARPNSNYKNFIKGTKFDNRLLEALYAKRPRPVVFRRMAEIAKSVGRGDLAQEIERIIKAYTVYRISKPLKPRRARPKVKPLVPPWVTRQQESVSVFEKTLEQALLSEIEKLPKWKLDRLVEDAQEHKRYDIYHSTTLEGYRITPEEVDAVVLGKAPVEIKDKEKHIEQIKNRMAILGYAEVFDFIIGQVKKDFGKGRVSEQLVKDVYYHLFKPSADSGIIDYFDLVSYRIIPAFIRGTRYVPPGPEKLTELMESFERSINRVKNAVIKAILAHYFFVTIHPYVDGNGRTARLLMNYFLLTSGYRWITIRAEQRKPYFDALTEGQLHEDIVPFGKFIITLMK
ncbi:MAG: Fic family protein [Actinomycetota bacterium]